MLRVAKMFAFSAWKAATRQHGATPRVSRRHHGLSPWRGETESSAFAGAKPV